MISANDSSFHQRIRQKFVQSFKPLIYVKIYPQNNVTFPAYFGHLAEEQTDKLCGSITRSRRQLAQTGNVIKRGETRERSDLFCVVRGRDVRNFCADKVSALARILPNTHDLRCEDISTRMFNHPADLYREIRSCRDYANRTS